MSNGRERHLIKEKLWGWACESVVAIDAVTANGQLVRADTNTNKDLFWAARGGGPNFPGIVTRFHLQTRSAPRVMRSSVYVYPLEYYKMAMNWALKVRSRSYHTYDSADCPRLPPPLRTPSSSLPSGVTTMEFSSLVS